MRDFPHDCGTVDTYGRWYPKHHQDKHARGRAIWQINLNYIIFSTYPYRPSPLIYVA